MLHHHAALNFSFDYSIESESANNEIIEHYYRGKFISNALKDNVSKNLTEHNRSGGSINGGFNYIQKFRSDSNAALLWSVGLHSRYYLDLSFPQDAFEIYFRGNKQFRGKQAELDDIYLRSISYQQFYFGIHKDYYRSSTQSGWSAALALNKGQKLFSLEIPKASVITADDGYYLDVDLSIKIRQNDSASSALSAFNGFGFSGFLQYYHRNKQGHEFRMAANNLGFINWNNKSSYVPADSTFRFEGIDISQLFDFTDTVKATINNDSSFVQGFLTRREKQSFTHLLPFETGISYRHVFNDRIYLESGIRQRWFTKAIPLIYSEVAYQFNEQHKARTKLSYGNYSGLRLGLAYSFNYRNSWSFSIESDYLSSLLVYSSGRSQGAFVSLSKYF